MTLKNILISKLISIGAIQYGNFTLKSGKQSDIYIDLRKLMSYPILYSYIFDLINPEIYDNIDLISGVPFGGLPLANFISIKKNIPQILIRDIAKSHGTLKQIEGNYSEGNNMLLVDDVITTGISLMEKIDIVKEYKINVKHILVILDREDSGTQELIKMGYKITSIFKLSELINFKLENSEYFSNYLANNIYRTCLEKQSNLIVSCDYTNADDICDLLDAIGDKIIAVKIHADIIKDFNEKFVAKLLYLKTQHKFFIIEDRKLADIGNIVLEQLGNGIYGWPDMVTVHSITGIDMINAINDRFSDLGILLISELSTANNLITDEYTKKTIEMANKCKNCTGLISQSNVYKYMNKFDHLTFSPGINLSVKSDSMGQTYNKGTNGLLWIVGRGIYNAVDPVSECELYRTQGWKHFLNY